MMNTNQRISSLGKDTKLYSWWSKMTPQQKTMMGVRAGMAVGMGYGGVKLKQWLNKDKNQPNQQGDQQDNNNTQDTQNQQATDNTNTNTPDTQTGEKPGFLKSMWNKITGNGDNADATSTAGGGVDAGDAVENTSSFFFSDRSLRSITKFYSVYTDDEYTKDQYYMQDGWRPSYNTKEDAKKEVADEAIKYGLLGAGALGLGYYLFS